MEVGALGCGKPGQRAEGKCFPISPPDLCSFKIWGMVLGWKPLQILKTFGPCLSFASFFGPCSENKLCSEFPGS